MVRNAFTFFKGNLRRSDLNALVDLHRIAVDDLAIELQSDFNSERTLTRCSWTNDGYYRLTGFAHEPENITRKRITIQTVVRRSSPPINWLRVKRISDFEN